MRLLKSAMAAAALALTLAHSQPAAAAKYTVTYSGVMNADIYSFSHTDTFSFSFDVNDAAPDLVPGDATVGLYATISNLQGSVSNGYTFSIGAPNQDLLVQNDFLGVQDFVSLEASSASGGSVGGQPLTKIGFGFCCNTTMISSDGIPNLASLLSLSDQENFLLVFGSGLDAFAVGGTITAAALSQTPLPATLPLFASALGGLGFVGHRKRRQRVAARRSA